MSNRFLNNKLRFADKIAATTEYTETQCSATHIAACPSHKAREYRTEGNYFCRIEIGKKRVSNSHGTFVYRHVYIVLPYAHGGVIEGFSKDASMSPQVTGLDFNSILNTFELLAKR